MKCWSVRPVFDDEPRPRQKLIEGDDLRVVQVTPEGLEGCSLHVAIITLA